LITAWRITRDEYQTTAMDGEGASLYGGRWNHPGTRMVYLAEAKSLAAMEIVVHVDRSLLSVPYVAIPVEFPDEVFQELCPLPQGWDNMVAPVSAIQAGDDWIKSQASVLLRVPSAAVKGEWNYLLNPTHPDIQSVRIGKPKSFVFDLRLR